MTRSLFVSPLVVLFLVACGDLEIARHGSGETEHADNGTAGIEFPDNEENDPEVELDVDGDCDGYTAEVDDT